MLTYWIPDDLCLLPGSPSHQIGVGSFVINDRREVQISKLNFLLNIILSFVKK